MIKAIKEYIEKYEHIEKGRVNNDYLGEGPTEYSIEPTPIDPVIEEYIDGSGGRYQFAFVFASRESYGQDVIQNMLNSKFYEDFSNWIRSENKKGNLPNIEGIESIECTSTPYAYQTSIDTARYQMQMRIIYEK